MPPELYTLSPIDKIRSMLSGSQGQRLSQYLAGPYARGSTQQAMLEQGYNPDSDLASEMFYERSLAGGEPVPMHRVPGGNTFSTLGGVSYLQQDGNMLRPEGFVGVLPASKMANEDGGFVFSDLPALARHESAHAVQPPYPEATHESLAQEVGPVMGDLAHMATAFRQQTGRELQKDFFPQEAGATYNPSIDWMSRMAAKHRFPHSDMNQLLTTPAGRRWLELLAGSPQEGQ